MLFVVTFIVALLVSVALTPVVRLLARRFNVVDHPDGHRKFHRDPTPLGGGISILLSFLAAVSVALLLSIGQRQALAADKWFLLGGLSSIVTIALIGLLDDRFCLRGRQKLAGQVLAIGLWLASGLWIEQIRILDIEIALGLLAVPFTAFWLLGAINSLNLLDGVDGLATSIGIVLSASIGAIALISEQRTEAFLAFAMAGALVGFLAYNRPPASIFLGDSGSMLIGLVLGVLAIRGSLKGPATVALAAPLAIWAIPIMDSGMAILRRKLTGQSIYSSDRAHLHHVLERRGWPTVIVVGVLCMVTSLAAVASVFWQNELIAVVTVAIVAVTLVVTGIFGRHEVHLLSKRGTHLARTLVPLSKSRDSHVSQFRARSGDSEKWDELWGTLTEFADRFELSVVRLNVRVPNHEEEYHATWKSKDRPLDKDLWRSEIPLNTRSTTVGRLTIAGSYSGEDVCTWMGDLISGLKPFETQLNELLEGEDEPPQPKITVRRPSKAVAEPAKS